FVYARLMRAEADEPTGYPPAELDAWAKRARAWSRGEPPADWPLIQSSAAAAAPRDVYVYFIAAAKARNPAAAMGLIERLPHD
ncbi:MAG TPA: DUF72 domain-containing protein, partial [Ottowia sp.]|uniref:DUF72 domain-containing protein n=1 Tax=Ottowia sp. TaxID=1898956 RepID=UPI002C9BCF77